MGSNIAYTWTPKQVGDWLNSVGFTHHRALFINQCISGEDLFDLTLEMVKGLDVDTMVAEQIILAIDGLGDF